MSYTSPIQHTHVPGGLGSRTSPIIMHIPGGVVPIYPGIWAPAQLHPTPTHPGVWRPSTRGSGVLHIPHPTPTYPGVWGPAHPLSNTHIQGRLGSCSPPSNTHIPGGLMPTYLGIRAPGHLILAPTYPRLWCPPTQGSGVLLASLQHPHPPRCGTHVHRDPDPLPIRHLLGDSCVSGTHGEAAQVSWRSALRAQHRPARQNTPSKRANGREKKKTNQIPPPKKGGRGAPRHRGGGSGPLPPTSIRPIVLLWGSPESSAGLG